MKCTVIKTASAVTKTPSDRVEELKKLIAEIEVPFEPTVGDICFYDQEKDEKVFVSYREWSAAKSVYPASRYTPIGVVTIPASHDVYGTGECAIVSLKEMNYTTPDEGSINYQSIYWGQNNKDTGMQVYTTTVVCGTCQSPTVDATGVQAFTTDYWAYMPTDELAGRGYEGPSATDPEAFYNAYGTSTYGYDCAASPSPYLEDGSRNPAYYQTTSPSDETNALSSFDGVGNTNILCDLATAQSEWKTAETITNSYNSGYSPAACCCWRYHTDGTSQGDWYLPAMGELGYMIVRLEKISDTIEALADYYGEETGARINDYSGNYWSSTEYGSADAWCVSTLSGYEGTLLTSNKSASSYVRAFLRV